MKLRLPHSNGTFTFSRPIGLDSKTWIYLEPILQTLHQAQHQIGRFRFYSYLAAVMHTYEKAPGGSRQSPGYTGFFAIICLFASIFLVWALMRTSLVKTSLEMMSSPPVITGMASNAPVNFVAKP